MKNMIRALREERGWSQDQLAKRLGWTQVDISRVENERVPITEKEIQKMAHVFEVLPSVLLGENNIPSYVGRPSRALHKKPIKIIENIQFGPDTVPILGHANGAVEAVLLSSDSIIGQALRHPNQQGVKDAFAMYAVGDSMSPRYMPGELVYVASNKPPVSGQDCIIELNNGEGYLKQFHKRTDKEIVCRQLSPAKDWKRPIDVIKAIHAVVGRG